MAKSKKTPRKAASPASAAKNRPLSISSPKKTTPSKTRASSGNEAPSTTQDKASSPTRRKVAPVSPSKALASPSKRPSPAGKAKAQPKKQPPTKASQNKSKHTIETQASTSKTAKIITDPNLFVDSDSEEEEVEVVSPPSGGEIYRKLTNSVSDREHLAMTVKAYVARELFRHVKFITNPTKLAYYDRHQHPNTFCAVVTKGCGIPENADASNWWESIAKQAVRRKISQLRCDRLAGLKWAYYGKCNVVFSIICNIC